MEKITIHNATDEDLNSIVIVYDPETVTEEQQNIFTQWAIEKYGMVNNRLSSWKYNNCIFKYTNDVGFKLEYLNKQLKECRISVKLEDFINNN